MRNQYGRRLAINVVLAFLPATVVGVLLERTIKHYLFVLWPVVIAWLLGGIAILLIARRHQPDPAAGGQTLEKLTPAQALAIGGIQCVVMWPGVSRSLSTIVGGVLVGLNAVTCVSAMSAVKWLVAFLNRHGLSAFGYYRVGLGLIAAGLLLTGLL